MVAILPNITQAQGHLAPVHEWSERHPAATGGPALHSKAIGAGTDGEYIYSVYSNQFQAGTNVFQLVKYDEDGHVVAENNWPDWDAASEYGPYIPRAMQVVPVPGFPLRANIYVAGDIPDPLSEGRRIVVTCFDEDLTLRWMWVHQLVEGAMPDEQAVALDATDWFVGVVGRIRQPEGEYSWMTVAFSATGHANVAMPPQYFTPSDQAAWPASVALAGFATGDHVAIFGGGGISGSPGVGLLRAIQYDVGPNPTALSYETGFHYRSKAVRIRTTGERIYMASYGHNLANSPNMIRFEVFDWYKGLDWQHTYGAGALGNYVFDLSIATQTAPPIGQGAGWDAFAWITGLRINSDTTVDAVTIQYRDLGIKCDQFNPSICWLDVDPDWIAVYDDHAGGLAEGIIVRPASDFAGDHNDLIYVAGAYVPGEGNRLDQLLLGYTAEPAAVNKLPEFDEVQAAHSEDYDRPVSFVEYPHLGGFGVRRLVVGLRSDHPQDGQGMVTSLWCHSPLCTD